MDVREATSDDLEGWLEMRRELWGHHTLNPTIEIEDAMEVLRSPEHVCFLLVDPDTTYKGFIEGKLYLSESKPYVHVEGWYVRSDSREMGYGSWLMSELEQWSIHRAITIMTSDTTPEYPISPEAHAQCGFRKVTEVTIFVKEIN